MCEGFQSSYSSLMSEEKQTIKKLQSTKCMRLTPGRNQRQVNKAAGPFYSFICATLELSFAHSFIIEQSNPPESFLLRPVFHKSVTGNRQKIVTAKQKPLSRSYRMISLLDGCTLQMEIVMNLWLRRIKAMPGLQLEMSRESQKPPVSRPSSSLELEQLLNGTK